ncbi:uncharacterized protein LOC120195804 [Hibiscus syriacus]|uniref:uncharacterized protein LOC120195804 n=1 Tax=Hibiscus syriacus TaxID=106335 RepID=UPI0019247C3F|nr:uncharacterized protein LOC120195804 [Hibiscus syriacus]
MLLGSSDAHKVTILNLPEEHPLPSNDIPTSNANESCMYGKVGLSKGNGGGMIYKPFSGERLVPILPWVNADGTINKSVYNGFVRRVLGTVMQNPGILEDDIIRRMDVLNPQVCCYIFLLFRLKAEACGHYVECLASPRALRWENG